MARHSNVRKPRRNLICRLRRLIVSGNHMKAFQRQRIEILLLHAEGMTAIGIATTLGIHPNTVYHHLHAYQEGGFLKLIRARRRGAAPRIKASQRTLIARIADRSPADYGLPYGRWSLSKLKEYLIRKRVIQAISCEHLRRILKKRVSNSNVSSENLQDKTREESQF